MNKEEIINKKYLTDSGLAIDLMEGKLDIDNPLIRNAVTQIGAYDEIYNEVYLRVIVSYNFTDNTMIGSKLLYDAIDALYVDGEEFDIKNLVVESNKVSLPVGYTGEHVVEFNLGSDIFRESAMLGSANYTIVEVPDKNNPITHANGYEFVDLGLPSGTLWATKNIGANSPTEPGLYFPWASTTGYKDATEHKFDFNEGNTPYIDDAGINKYQAKDDTNTGVHDDKLELDIEDDAAAFNMGGAWRIPSKDQFVELCDNTDESWTTIDGVNGYKFISKKNSDLFIFIPAAGFCDGSSLRSVGSDGFVWSRSLRPVGSRYAYDLYFHLEYYYSSYRSNRYSGFSVRGVL